MSVYGLFVVAVDKTVANGTRNGIDRRRRAFFSTLSNTVPSPSMRLRGLEYYCRIEAAAVVVACAVIAVTG